MATMGASGWRQGRPERLEAAQPRGFPWPGRRFLSRKPAFANLQFGEWSDPPIGPKWQDAVVAAIRTTGVSTDEPCGGRKRRRSGRAPPRNQREETNPTARNS
jgi:hypothetical protein